MLAQLRENPAVKLARAVEFPGSGLRSDLRGSPLSDRIKKLAWLLSLREAPRQSNQRSEQHPRMSFTVFLGNLPAWVTADDIQSWLNSEALVADSIKVIRNPETQESKGFAFIEAPNAEEMQSIIRRFDRAPLEDRMLRANPAQPPRPKGPSTRPESSRSTGQAHGLTPPGSSNRTSRKRTPLKAPSPRSWPRLCNSAGPDARGHSRQRDVVLLSPWPVVYSMTRF